MVDSRVPLREEAGENGDSMDLIRAVAQSSVAEQDPGAFAGVVGEAQSSVGVILDRDEDSPEVEVDSKRLRKAVTESQGSAISEDPKAPGLTGSIRIGTAPQRKDDLPGWEL